MIKFNQHGLPILSPSRSALDTVQQQRKRLAERRIWLQIKLYEQDNKCYWCNCKILLNEQFDRLEFPITTTAKVATCDHLVPLGLDGEDALNNTVAACSDCNSLRGCSLGPPTVARVSSTE